jgi:cytochrome b561
LVAVSIGSIWNSCTQVDLCCPARVRPLLQKIRMTNDPGATEHYDGSTIALHWVVVLLVACQWLGALTIDWFPRRALRIDVRSVHILIGALLACVMVARTAWRVRGGRALPTAQSGVMGLAARVVHGALNLSVASVLIIGVFTAWIRGDSLFGLLQISPLGAYARDVRHALAERILGVHALGANLILILAGLHAGAALVHHFCLKDGVLRRMSPWDVVGCRGEGPAGLPDPSRRGGRPSV